MARHDTSKPCNRTDQPKQRHSYIILFEGISSGPRTFYKHMKCPNRTGDFKHAQRLRKEMPPCPATPQRHAHLPLEMPLSTEAFLFSCSTFLYKAVVDPRRKGLH